MPFDDFQDTTKLAEAFERAKVRDDLNNDMAGRETGRIRRVVHDDIGPAVEKRKAQERLERLLAETALQALLADPVYRKRWEDFGTFLETYATAAKSALQQAIETSGLAHHAVREALENAHTLDGKAVFETDDGRYVYRNGIEVDPNNAARIVRNKDAISYADFLLLEAAAQNSDRAITDIRVYKEKLDSAEAKRTDPDNPYKSPEEMEAEQEHLESVVPDAVREVLNVPGAGSAGPQPDAAASKPII